MAAEIVVNCHNGTDTVGGNANDINPLNTTSVNLTDYNTGSDSGWDMVSNVTLTADSSGRNASVGGAPSYYSTINSEGNYFNTGSGGAIEITLSNIPTNVTAFDITIFLCTTFSSQTDLSASCEAQSNTGWDSTNNTTGATFTLAGCVPDVNDEALITLNNDSSAFVFFNGFHIDNVQETGGGLSIPIAAYHYNIRQNG